MHASPGIPMAAKTYLRWVLTVWWDVDEEEPVLQGMLKCGEGVVGIFGVPVIDRQADGCHPSCQHTTNGISCGLARLGDQLL